MLRGICQPSFFGFPSTLSMDGWVVPSYTLQSPIPLAAVVHQIVKYQGQDGFPHGHYALVVAIENLRLNRGENPCLASPLREQGSKLVFNRGRTHGTYFGYTCRSGSRTGCGRIDTNHQRHRFPCERERCSSCLPYARVPAHPTGGMMRSSLGWRELWLTPEQRPPSYRRLRKAACRFGPLKPPLSPCSSLND